MVRLHTVQLAGIDLWFIQWRNGRALFQRQSRLTLAAVGLLAKRQPIPIRRDAP